MIKMRYRLAILFVAMFSLAALLYTTFTLSAAYQLLDHRYSEILERSSITGVNRYGIVVEKDDAQRLLLVALRRFAGDTARIVVHVPPTADISHQELIAAGDAYISLSEARAGTFSELIPGTMVSLQLSKTGDKLYSGFVIFGNPL